MLYAFGFERLGVLDSDLYFVNPAPRPGQEGAERGVRLEVRMLQRGELKGSIYSARPIEAGRPLWRADLLESVSSPPGSLDRAHHHPAFRGWEPGRRVFDPGLSEDPVRWVGQQLSDFAALLRQAGTEPDETLAADMAQLREHAPEITACVARLLDQVKAAQLAVAAAGPPPASARISWL